MPYEGEHLDVAIPDHLALVSLVNMDRLKVASLTAMEVSDRFDKCRDSSFIHGRKVSDASWQRQIQIRPLPIYVSYRGEVIDFDLSNRQGSIPENRTHASRGNSVRMLTLSR